MGTITEQENGPQAALQEPQTAEPARPDPWDDTDTPEGMATYVVQRLEQGVTDDLRQTWADIARVHVPKKTQTKTVLQGALALAGITPAASDRFHVLDDAAAYSYRVEVTPPSLPAYRVV